MKLSQSLFILAGSLLAIGISARSASAQIIYQDTFTGTADTSLNGKAPGKANDLAGGSTGATWSTSLFDYTGTGGVSTVNDGDAILPFAVQSGEIYTLTADITPVTTGGSGWLGFGFAQTATPYGGAGWYDSDKAAPWLFLTDGTSQVPVGWQGPGANGLVVGTGQTAGTLQYVITLNTTGSQWTYSFSGPGIDSGTLDYAAGQNPKILGIVIGQQAGGGSTVGTFDSIDLSVASAPEPSTYALMGLGLVSLLAMMRFRRQC